MISTLVAAMFGNAKGKKKQWAELSRSQRIAIIVGATLQLTLLAAALWDIRRRPAAEIRGPKRAWTAAAFINFVGPITYFLFGRRRPGRGG